MVAGDPESELMWIRHANGRMLPCVPHVGGDSYSPREVREKAIKRKDPFISPHSTFRGIRNAYQAIQFLRDFGPLSRDDPATIFVDRRRVSEPHFFINLNEFFRMQRIYAAIADLWDKYPDVEMLRESWTRILRAKNGPFELYYTHMDTWHVSERASDAENFSWASEPDPLEWTTSGPATELQSLTFGLISRELQRHLPGKIEWTLRLDEQGRPTFRPEAAITSLWSAMWESFALDSVGGIVWRICPHCGKVFYPARRDRFFCTPRLQQLHSKRTWWRSRTIKQKSISSKHPRNRR